MMGSETSSDVGDNPIRTELRARWERLLAGAPEVSETVEWAQLQLGDYGDEVNFNGLHHLSDLWDVTTPELDAERIQAWSARYRAWLEQAQAFDDDPILWNRQWALAYIERMKDLPVLQAKLAKALADDGMID
jgi:hypothetical protein